MAKEPYKATNRKAYVDQMCRYLDRRERMRLFVVLTSWHVADDGSMVRDVTTSHWEKAFQSLAGRYLPLPVRNVFKRKTALCSYTTAFQLRQKPNLSDASIRDLQELYQIPSLNDDFGKYFVGSWYCRDTPLPFSTASTWERVRVQLRDPQDRNVVLPASTIRAYPGTHMSDAARYNFVLLHSDQNSSVNGVDDYGIQGNYLMRLCH